MRLFLKDLLAFVALGAFSLVALGWLDAALPTRVKPVDGQPAGLAPGGCDDT